jgi:hypothetical protein
MEKKTSAISVTRLGLNANIAIALNRIKTQDAEIAALCAEVESLATEGRRLRGLLAGVCDAAGMAVGQLERVVAKQTVEPSFMARACLVTKEAIAAGS